MSGLKSLSRRSFLKGSALLGAGIVGSVSITACASEAHADSVAWDRETDVLVVGSGFAGYSAALHAHDAGAEVVLIDKRGSDGGNSLKCDGDFGVCGSSAQKEHGIQDSVDTYVNDMLVAGLYLNDIEKCRTIAESTNGIYEWLNDLGVTWVQGNEGKTEVLPYGGHSIRRTLKAEGAGAAIVGALRNEANTKGLAVECHLLLTELVKNDEGRVIGAKVVKNNETQERSDSPHGQCINIKARKGVVLATGGFGGDVAWRMQHDPRLDETVGDTNRSGANREALEPALHADALAVHMDWIQLGPWCSPDLETYGPDGTYIDAGFPYGPVVAPQTGKRIVNELTDRKRYCDAILANEEPLIQIVDERNLPEWSLEYLEKCIEAGCTWRMDSIEEIAERFDIPLEALQTEIARYNTFVANKVDGDFGKAIPEDALPVEQPPYCVTRVWPRVHHCMGGVKTDADCRVIDVSLQPINGLFAAGEATGGVHGACRLGSCSIADCLVNGSLAGRNAAQEESWC